MSRLNFGVVLTMLDPLSRNVELGQVEFDGERVEEHWKARFDLWNGCLL